MVIFLPSSTNGSQNLPAFFLFFFMHSFQRNKHLHCWLKLWKIMDWETSSNVTLSSCMSSFSSLKEWLRYLAWIALCDETLGTRNHGFICSYKRATSKLGNWQNVLSITNNIVSSVNTLIFNVVWHKYCGNNISKLFYVSLAKRLVKFGKFLKYTLSPIAVQAYLSLLIFRTKLWQPCETIGKFENFSNIGHLVPKTQRGSSEKLMRLVRHEYYWYWRLNISFVLFIFSSGFFARPVQSFPVQWYRNPHVCVTVVPDAVYREVSTTYGLPHHGSLSLSCKESSFVTFSSCWGHIHSLLQGLDSFQIILLLRLKVRYVWSLRKEKKNLQCFSTLW